MERKASKILKYSLSFLLAALLLYLAFRGVDWHAFREGLDSCRWTFVLCSMACGLGAFAFRGLRWHQLIKPLDPSIRFITALNGVNIGNMANCALPGAGEFVRAGIVPRHSALSEDGSRKASYDRVLGTIVLERVWDFVSIALIIIALVVFKWESFGSFLRDRVFVPASSRLSVGLGWIAAAALVLVLAAVIVMVRLREKSRFCAKVCSVFTGLWKGVKSCTGMERKGLFFLYTVIIWTMYTMMAFSIIHAIPSLRPLGMMDAVFLMAAGSLASVVPVPGGFGAYHYLVALALSSLYGFPWEIGILFATLSHESQAVNMIVTGLISYVAESFSKVNNRQ